ncbi:S-adenosylmethionine decarboxylase [Candidatus Woesearchaeota archaeon]|nr:MAG: S-adenosylmethionine decarboxylase [Candidatus Woesearchaeota archaeon]
MKKDSWWGRICSVDLHQCDVKLVNNPLAIKRYVRQLCTLIKMKRHGPCRVERFGSGRLRGHSMMQFIETSSITAHFDDFGHRAFIDVFSCKKFDSKKVAAFSKKFFRAKRARTHVYERR